MTNTRDEIMDKVRQHYETVKQFGYEVVGVFLQGSQNYGLAYEGSDVDTKAIVLPSFEDVVLNRKPVSTTHIMPDNSHLDIKDIRLMFNTLKKQNINFVEILFTPYKVITSDYECLLAPVFQHNEELARYNVVDALKCICGMSVEKYHALEHPYPTILDKIEKFGYDPKQLHHILRLEEFIQKYIDRKSYEDCLLSTQKDYLISVKQGLHTLEEARKLSKESTERTYTLKEKFCSTYNDYNITNRIKLDSLLDGVITQCLKYYFVHSWN